VLPIGASLALHVGLVGVAAVVVPRAIARMPDVIPVQLVVEPPRLVEAPPTPPAPPPPPKRLTPPKPIATPLLKLEEPPAVPKREPEPAPPPVVTPSPEPPAAAPPAVASAPSSAPTPAAPTTLAPGVSWIESNTSSAAPSTAPPAVASRPPDSGITTVARPTGGYQVRPSYPSSARRLGVQGTTMLRIRVLEDGRVGEVDVEQSAGHPDLDQAATDAVRRWRFEPARRGDQAVAMWVRLPVEFRLK
jgi:protein TonB